jgi:hypothetical protein
MIHDGSSRIDKIQADYEQLANPQSEGAIPDPQRAALAFC